MTQNYSPAPPAVTFHGQLIGIFLGRRKGEDLQAVGRAVAVAGRGIEGDRYFFKEGTFSSKHGPDREVTLIETEALEGLAREYQLTLSPVQARRNLLTRGVPVNHLVGRTFAVGPVVLRGIRLCEPCGHLEGLTCLGIQKGLVHRGGLRAEVIQGGIVEIGCAITPHDG